MDVILFITHRINDRIYQRYNKIKNDLDNTKYKVFFVCPNNLNISDYDLSNFKNDGLDLTNDIKYGIGVYIKNDEEMDIPNKLYTCYKL